MSAVKKTDYSRAAEILAFITFMKTICRKRTRLIIHPVFRIMLRPTDPQAISSVCLTVGEDEHESLPLWGLGEIDLMEHNSLAGQQLLGFLAEWTAINGKDSHLTHGSNLGKKDEIFEKHTCI